LLALRVGGCRFAHLQFAKLDHATSHIQFQDCACVDLRIVDRVVT
jgi:hypothetical protein